MSLIRVANALLKNKNTFHGVIVPASKYSEKANKDGSSSSSSDDSTSSDDDRKSISKKQLNNSANDSLNKVDTLLGDLKPKDLKPNLFATARELAKKSAADGKGFSSDDEKPSISKSKQNVKTLTPRNNKDSMQKLDALLSDLKAFSQDQSPTSTKIPQPIGYKKFSEKNKPIVDAGRPTPTLEEVTKELGKELGEDAERELQRRLEEYPKVMPAKASQNIFELVYSMKKDGEEDQLNQSNEAEQQKPSPPFQVGGQKQKRFKSISELGRTPVRRSTKHQITPNIKEEKVNLFGEKPLNIFEIDKLDSEQAILPVWSKLELQEIHPIRYPRNYFEKMARWTEQGKVWKFPIDNEQGMDKEAAISFTQHIFLDEHLDPWCPHEGPVRHFMELVSIGLSRNPYLTVDEKIEHILWYREYFEEKKDKLRAMMEKGRDTARKLSK